MSKLLAEWFWTDRWSGSDGWLLPLKERGLYREMLSQAWKRGASLPEDPATIQAICNVSAADWEALWPAVKGFWKSEDGRLVNETQAKVYVDAKGRHERAQARSQAGAQASAQARRLAVLKQSTPSPSPSIRTMAEPPMPTPPGVRGDEDVDVLDAVWAIRRGGPHRYIHECLPVVRAIGLERTEAALETYLSAKENEKFKGSPADFAANYRMYLPKASERVVYAAEALRRAREL
jgi:uncharacterized protein YdaU (DUF1376 family)